MEPRACWVMLDEADRWPGMVLAWQRSGGGWRALVRYSQVMPEGYRLAYERWLPAEVLAQR